MRKLEGTTAVKGGFYFNRNAWEIVVVPGKAGVLPGEPTTTYFKVPALGLFLLAPVMGGLYVLFLPFIGFAMLFHQLGKLAARTAHKVGSDVAAALAPAWRPGEAYLAGKHAEPKPKEGGEAAVEAKPEPTPESLEGLMKEIDEKRENS